MWQDLRWCAYIHRKVTWSQTRFYCDYQSVTARRRFAAPPKNMVIPPHSLRIESSPKNDPHWESNFTPSSTLPRPLRGSRYNVASPHIVKEICFHSCIELQFLFHFCWDCKLTPHLSSLSSQWIFHLQWVRFLQGVTITTRDLKLNTGSDNQ